MLLALYIFNVFAGGYIVFALEPRLNFRWVDIFGELTDLSPAKRNHGTCMQYNDVVWMMGVTITNLGFGDFTPSSTVSRSMIALLSLLGIFQTALIVGVLSETLVIPPDEKRILASVEKQRKSLPVTSGHFRSHFWLRCGSNQTTCSCEIDSSNMETIQI